MEAQQKTDDPKKIIDGNPTKDFFITMLIKDITLIDAIGDLIDNSVDGANRSAKNFNLKNLSDFEIKIKITKDKFIIEDNCGGIDIEVARKYAFRFGRPSEYKIEEHSIGQFGIGMKRAFFKIGNYINVKSVSSNSKFETILNVESWRNDPLWSFPLSPQDDLITIPLKERGTIITITKLTIDATNNFEDNKNSTFETALIDKIRYDHLYSINKGLKIFINGKDITPPDFTLIYNDEFKPGFWNYKFDNGLTVDVITGISEDEKDDGGWYIFCNDRLITGPNITADTGWTGSKGNQTDGVALYHDQFYRFRGYVFFNSDDASKLPWNTTKTGIDKDSSIYQFVRGQMIEMMKPVMTLMNQLKKEKEKDTPKELRLLNYKVEQAKIISIYEVLKRKNKLNDTFIYPKIKVTSQTGMGNISYKKPYSEIDRVKKYFGVTKLGEVGEMTFDFFYNNKIGK